MNQYQANHNPSPRPSGKKGWINLLRILILLALLGLALWFFS